MIALLAPLALAVDVRVQVPAVAAAESRPLSSFASVDGDPAAGDCKARNARATPTIVEAFDVGLAFAGEAALPWDRIEALRPTLTARMAGWRSLSKAGCRPGEAVPSVLVAADRTVGDVQLMQLWKLLGDVGFGQIGLLVTADAPAPAPAKASGPPLGTIVVRAENVQTSEGGTFSRMEAPDLDLWARGLPPTTVLVVPAGVDAGRFATVWGQVAAAGRTAVIGFVPGRSASMAAGPAPRPTHLGDTVQVLVAGSGLVDFTGRLPDPPPPNPKKPPLVSADSGVLGAVPDGTAIDDGVIAGIGGVIGARGSQAGGLGARGAGLGGGTAEGLGGLGTQRSTAFGMPGDAPIILGALDRSLIDASLDPARPDITACWEQRLAKRPDLAGKVVIKFVIAKNGDVSSATVKSSTMSDPATEDCVAARIGRVRFPEPKGGGIVIVSYPFVFGAR